MFCVVADGQRGVPPPQVHREEEVSALSSEQLAQSGPGCMVLVLAQQQAQPSMSACTRPQLLLWCCEPPALSAAVHSLPLHSTFSSPPFNPAFRYGVDSVNVGDEGGFAPGIQVWHPGRAAGRAVPGLQELGTF